MIWLLMEAIVWLFHLTVFVIVMSLFVEIAAPGRFKTLHKIYKVILGFDEEES